MPEGEHSEATVDQKPEFDGGSFTIEFLSQSPSGFEAKTRESLSRHAPNTPLPEAKRIKAERDREPVKFRIGEHFTPKVGLRRIQREGNEISFDIQPVTFPTYRAISSPLEEEPSLEISKPAATASIIFTTEGNGSHKMLIQLRSNKNFFYGEIPGASVAGFLDGMLNHEREKRGTLRTVDTGFIVRNIQKEMSQEIGLDSEEVEEFRITGFARDKVRVHDEFLMLGITKLSGEEVSKRVGIRDVFHEGEKFFIAEGSPETIEKLLTQVKCPLPHTHVAAFVAAGYSLVLERNGQEAANAWKNKIEQGVRKNYQDIDALVANYYVANPDKLKEQPDGKPPRNANGYEPAYLPQDQGLPEVASELKRVGII